MARKHGPSKDADEELEQQIPEMRSPKSQTEMQPGLTVLRQYIKDLSFESPNTPETLQSPGHNAQIHIDVNVTVTPVPNEVYEVILKLEVHTKNDAGVIYHLDLAYGGMFRLRNIPNNLLEPTLWVNCPTILFPFLRRVAADVTIDGGFPPLMLDPINFGTLYAQQLAQAKGQPGAKSAIRRPSITE